VGNRAQVSFEFLMLFGFLFIVFIALVVILQQRSSEVFDQNVQNSQLAVGDVMVREIRYAYIAGDGYTRDFELPMKVNSWNYTMKVVKSLTAPAAAVLIVSVNASSNVVPSTFSLPPQLTQTWCLPAATTTATIQNIGGSVLLCIPRTHQMG
jgi:hypothetical protein